MRNQLATNSSAETQIAIPLEKKFFFHDIAIHCRANHAQIVSVLEEMLGAFPEPEQIRGEIQYNVLCYEHAARFPIQLPAARHRTGAIQLVTGTVLKYYHNDDSTLEFQHFSPLAEVNATALTIIERDAPILTTQ